MKTIADDLRRAVAAAAPQLLAVDEAASARASAPGKWCPRELVGHLIDSAANNHQRFVRARYLPADGSFELVFPSYDQDAWVSGQRYREAPWRELIELFRLYNLHLARVFESTPPELARRVTTRHNFERIAWRTLPAGEPATLAYFAQDYVGHLHHHLAALASS